MAQTVHLKLKIDGNEIDGECTIRSLDRMDSIECASFRHAVALPIDPSSSLPTGQRQHEVVVIRKQVDRSTPLLLKALCQHQIVSEAEFRFYRSKDVRSSRLHTYSTEEHFYTVLISGGNIVGVAQVSEDDVIGGRNAPPMMEDISFSYKDIEWTYVDGGIVHSDSLGRLV